MSQSTQSRGAAIVTGASQGIGRAIAFRLAQDGFSVAVNDLPSRLEALKEVATELSTYGRVIEVPGDVGSEADVQTLIEKTVTQLGDLEVVSGTCYCSSILEHKLSSWRMREFHPTSLFWKAGTKIAAATCALSDTSQSLWIISIA